MTGESTADPDWSALEELRGRITVLDSQMSHLVAERQALVQEYERHRAAIIGRIQPAVPPPIPATPGASLPPHQEWSGARVRALLLWLGAALLAISAVTFTAVAWSRLNEAGRAGLLIGATAVVTGLALALRRRLPMTAEAFAGLAVILTLIDAYALRRAGVAADLPWEVWWAIGTFASAGFAAALGMAVGRRTTRFAVAALLPVAPELLTLRATYAWQLALILAVLAAAIVYAQSRWARHLYREDQVVLGLHAGGSWLAGAALAALDAPDGPYLQSAVPKALAVAALAAAPALASRRLVDRPLRTIAAALAIGTPAAVLLTLTDPFFGDDGQFTTAVFAGAATLLVATFLAGTPRAGAVIAGATFMVPGTLWAVHETVRTAIGPLEWLMDAWTGSLNRIAREVYYGPNTWPAFSGSWAAVAALAAVSAVGLAAGVRLVRLRPVLFGIASAAIGLIAASAPVLAGATVLPTLICTVATTVSLTLAAVRGRWTLLAGAAVAAAPTAGWAALSPAASVVTLAVLTMAAATASVTARAPAARAGCAALAALLAVGFSGVAARAVGAGLPAAGFAAVVAAGAVVLVAISVLGDQPGVGVAVQAAGALAAGAGLTAAAGSATWLAASLTALVPVAALGALGTRRRVGYGAAALALALAATWAWLAAAEVTVVEAYTAPAALVALIAGILQWRAAPGRSWLTLGPAILLGIGPTLVLGMADDDVARLGIAAALALAVVVGGAVWRLQAPLCLGAAALLALAIDQWGEEIVRLPRWITVGAVGILLMWIGATFEARRRDWRQASAVFSQYR